MTLRPRLIPCLLLKGPGLVKTVRFDKPTYIGDPINAVKLFNDLEVDELIFLDISATREGREPDYERIREIASEAFMPIGYGGGIHSVSQAERLFALGVEKVVVTSEAGRRPEFVSELAVAFGSQSVVAGLDIKRDWLGRCKALIRYGRFLRGRDPLLLAKEFVERGAGELMLHSMDRDGYMTGYDLRLVSVISGAVPVPVVACGGAGSLSDVVAVINAGASAAAAGSLFVFKGPHRAVLINYPTQDELRALFQED